MILLMTYGLFAADARHRQQDTDGDARHRHRHESSIGKRNRHELADRRSSWLQEELEYEDEEEDDYEARPYYERSYPRSSRIGSHGRMFEPRYPAKYHRGYRGTGWHDEDDERRRGSPRHGWRSYRPRSDRTHRRLGHSRNRDSDYDYDEDEAERDKARGYDEDHAERHHAWWKNGRKHRIAARRGWRPDARKRHRASGRPSERPSTDAEGSRRSNSSESGLSFSNDDRRRNENEDYEYHVDELDDAERDEEEDEAWRETEDEDPIVDDEELENDFYNSEKKPPLRTFDDIIRRLTSDDPTTPKATVKRDYRNIEIEKYTKPDAFGNFKYRSKNLSKPLLYGKLMSPYSASKKENSTMKLDALTDRKLSKNGKNGKNGKSANRQARTKSLEQEYDEYVNAPDNEKEEDLIKAGVEDSGMQADVTNNVSQNAFINLCVAVCSR